MRFSFHFLLSAFPSVEHKRYEDGGYTSLAHFITSHEITGTHGRGKTSLRLKGASAVGDSRRSTWGRITEIATAANSLGPPAACGRPPSLLGAGAWAPQSLAIPEEAGKAMEASGLGEEEST